MKSETTQNGLEIITQFISPTYIDRIIEGYKEDEENIIDLSELDKLKGEELSSYIDDKLVNILCDLFENVGVVKWG